MTKTALELERSILELIAEQRGDFDALALAVFAFQFAHNPVYQRYCVSRDATPATVAHWQAIPAVPTAAFKDFTLACFPVAETVAEFHTSGTTRERSGRHYLRSLALYHAASRASFAADLLPDQGRLTMYCLTPSPTDAPHSSLAHMLGYLAGEFAARSEFFVHNGQLALARLVTVLRGSREPVLLLGTAFAFVHLLEYCESQSLRLPLADGSRIMETGGFKGRSREVPRAELYARLTERLSVPNQRIVNEYGMTELSTQFYDRSLVAGQATDHKRVPPWARVQLIDPQTGNPAASGVTGMIRVLDLANLWSNMVVQTEDLGSGQLDGFTVIGRAPGADVRGCSLTAETLRLHR